MKPIRFVMVGGFLGAGKTTTLARLAHHYRGRGQNVGIVTNDQAEDLVDTQNLRAQGLPVADVAGAYRGQEHPRVESLSELESWLQKS